MIGKQVSTILIKIVQVEFAKNQSELILLMNLITSSDSIIYFREFHGEQICALFVKIVFKNRLDHAT